MRTSRRAGDEPTPRPRSFPIPSRATRNYTIISVDDHLIEPAHLFEGRMPARPRRRARRRSSRSTTAVRPGSTKTSSTRRSGSTRSPGRPKDEWSMEPARFDEMRRGCCDIEARIADMDLDGVYATLCFPSLIAGLRGHDLRQEQGPGARARRAAGVERLAHRGVGRPASRSHHPAAARVDERPRDRGGRHAHATRRAASRP